MITGKFIIQERENGEVYLTLNDVRVDNGTKDEITLLQEDVLTLADDIGWFSEDDEIKGSQLWLKEL